MASAAFCASDLARSKGPQKCTTTTPWQVSGASGEVRIYAVIDPEDKINEMHDGGDKIDNNIGYTLLNIASAGFLDPGVQQEQEYQAIIYEDTTGSGGFGLYLPTANPPVGQSASQVETIRYELVPTYERLVGVVGEPIQVLAFRGGQEAPEDSHQFGDIPAVLTAFYRDSDLLPGTVEGNLKLYRMDGSTWVEATCAGQQIVRFPEDNRIAVPVCEAGTFVLSDRQPLPQRNIYLPVIKK